MTKKNFRKENPALGHISSSDIYKKEGGTSTPNTPGVQLVQELPSKAKKRPRINMAFEEENLWYLQQISRIKGFSITAYVNDLVRKDRDKNKPILNEVEKLLNNGFYNK